MAAEATTASRSRWWPEVAVQPRADRLSIPTWGRAPDRTPTETPVADDLFERTAPLYAFLREHLFRDDTDRIAQALWPVGEPPTDALLLEIGCGPGVYARRLAARYPGVRAVGVDRSAALLALANARADSDRLTNCRFRQGNALALDWAAESVDAVIASRLFTVVDGSHALREIHRILRPGGRCFLAEPVSVLGTLAPFAALRLAGWLVGARPAQDGGCASGHEPHRLTGREFDTLVRSQPWSDCAVIRERGYLYAVCQKPSGRPA